MDFGYVTVYLIIFLLMYGLYREAINTFKVQTTTDKKKFALNLVGTISLAGLLLSYILNIFLNLKVIVESTIINIDSTGYLCFLFLKTFLLSKGIVYILKNKQQKPVRTLKI